MLEASSILLDDFVDVTLNTWGTDADGSRIVVSTRTYRDVPATVLVGKPSSRTIGTEPETGLFRTTEFTPVTVQFDERLPFNVHDLIAWYDPAGTLHTYLVIGYGPLAGVAGAWVATCEERL